MCSKLGNTALKWYAPFKGMNLERRPSESLCNFLKSKLNLFQTPKSPRERAPALLGTKDLWRADLLKYLVRGFHILYSVDICNLDFVLLTWPHSLPFRSRSTSATHWSAAFLRERIPRAKRSQHRAAHQPRVQLFWVTNTPLAGCCWDCPNSGCALGFTLSSFACRSKV